jgi:CDP-diacylglycerol---glycerol-3-phosphate 3-phosphatidyltransferase
MCSTLLFPFSFCQKPSEGVQFVQLLPFVACFMPIYTIINFLSFLRAPLAFLFMIDNTYSRLVVVLLAMVTDFLDGFLARRWKMTSQVGAVLDPVTDKLFVIIAASVLIQEGSLEIWQALTMISRDFAVLLFVCYLFIKGNLFSFKTQSIWTGKITTTLQFFVLLGLIFHFTIPVYVFIIFIALGLLALLELYSLEQEKIDILD